MTETVTNEETTKVEMMQQQLSQQQQQQPQQSQQSHSQSQSQPSVTSGLCTIGWSTARGVTYAVGSAASGVASGVVTGGVVGGILGAVRGTVVGVAWGTGIVVTGAVSGLTEVAKGVVAAQHERVKNRNGRDEVGEKSTTTKEDTNLEMDTDNNEVEKKKKKKKEDDDGVVVLFGGGEGDCPYNVKESDETESTTIEQQQQQQPNDTIIRTNMEKKHNIDSENEAEKKEDEVVRVDSGERDCICDVETESRTTTIEQQPNGTIIKTILEKKHDVDSENEAEKKEDGVVRVVRLEGDCPCDVETESTTIEQQQNGTNLDKKHNIDSDKKDKDDGVQNVITDDENMTIMGSDP